MSAVSFHSSALLLSVDFVARFPHISGASWIILFSTLQCSSLTQTLLQYYSYVTLFPSSIRTPYAHRTIVNVIISLHVSLSPAFCSIITCHLFSYTFLHRITILCLFSFLVCHSSLFINIPHFLLHMTGDRLVHVHSNQMEYLLVLWNLARKHWCLFLDHALTRQGHRIGMMWTTILGFYSFIFLS